mgnify:CR=1 FL=1
MSGAADPVRHPEEERKTALGGVGAGALVVRSHVYGWCPGAFGMNYAERMFHELTGELPCPVDAVRHATPILATDSTIGCGAFSKPPRMRWTSSG